jgi:hypothetical protein
MCVSLSFRKRVIGINVCSSSIFMYNISKLSTCKTINFHEINKISTNFCVAKRDTKKRYLDLWKLLCKPKLVLADLLKHFKNEFLGDVLQELL